MELKNMFTKNDTLIYKGIGILLIVIHNYLHWQKGFDIENEHQFNPDNIYIFLENLYPFQWTETASAIFGYLGHYGVQLFIFFSAYGLSQQFINNKSNFSYFNYLLKRFKKLYFLLFFGVLLFLITYFLIHGKFYGKVRTFEQLFLLATSISNFRDFTLYRMFVGPFWFFGLMIQLYIVFPFLFHLLKKYSISIILPLIFIIIYPLYILDLNTRFTLFGTIIGHSPEVILGIFLALNNKTKPSILVFLISLITFIGSQLNVYLFPLGFISALIIMIYLIETFKSSINNFWYNVLKYVGEISMTLFIVNGFFRLFPLFNIEDMSLRGERIFLYLLLLFISCYFIHKIYIYLTIKFKI